MPVDIPGLFWGQFNKSRDRNDDKARQDLQAQQFMQQLGLQRDQFNTTNAHWDQNRIDEQARQAQQDTWAVLQAKAQGLVQDAPSIQLPGMVKAPTEGQPWLGMNPNDAQGAPILPQSGPAMGSVPEFFAGLQRVEAPNAVNFGGSKVTFVSPEQRAQTALNTHLQQFIGEHEATNKLRQNDIARKVAEIDASPDIPKAYKDRFKMNVTLGIPFDQAVSLKDDLRDAFNNGDQVKIEQILTLMDKTAAIEQKYKSNPWDTPGAANFLQNQNMLRLMGGLGNPAPDDPNNKGGLAERIKAKITELKNTPGYYAGRKDLQTQVGMLEQEVAKLQPMAKVNDDDAKFEAMMKAINAAESK